LKKLLFKFFINKNFMDIDINFIDIIYPQWKSKSKM